MASSANPLLPSLPAHPTNPPQPLLLISLDGKGQEEAIGWAVLPPEAQGHGASSLPLNPSSGPWAALYLCT